MDLDFTPNINAAHILIAENHPDDMAWTATILESAGYNIHKAYNAGDALFALEHGQFDLIVVDSEMRDRDRRALVDWLTRYAPAPWIVLEGGSDRLRVHQGAAAVLKRPFNADALVSLIEKVLYKKTDPLPIPSTPAGREETSPILERRLIEQQTLSALVRSLSAVLDLDVLLTQVVDAAVRLCSAEEGLLLLPDEEATALYIRAVKGIDSETARNFRIKTQDTLAGQVFRSGQPLLVGDQGPQKLKTEYLVKSLLYVPLSIWGQTIGVLGVNNKQSDRTFTEHDSELLLDLAAHAAIAIQNARLYEESVTRARELSMLVQAGEAANSTLALDRVLSTIAGQLIGAVNMSECYIGEWVPDRRRIETLAVRYHTLWPAAQGPHLPANSSRLVEQAFSQKRPVVLTLDNQGLSDHPPYTWPPHRHQAQSIVYVPLYTTERPLGLVTLYHVQDTCPAGGYAHTLYLQVQQFALDLIVPLAGVNPRSEQNALFQTAQRILGATGADWCELALWNQAQRTFNTGLVYGEALWPSEPKPGFDLAQFPQLAPILTEQAALTGTLDLPLAQSGTGQEKSFLGVPLVVKGNTAGLVVLTDTLGNRHFSQREIKLVQALVLQAANALENARLFCDLQLSLEELRRTQSKLIQTARLTAMGELAAAVAHQINNPLTTILGDTEMLLQDLPYDDPNLEAIQAISRAGHRAHEVARRLLAMARQQTQDETPEPLNVNETIRNTLTLVRNHLMQASINLILDLAQDIPLVSGIQGQLEDVWLNLLLNARDAVLHRPNPQIGISTTYDDTRDEVEIVVWDNGIGIPDALQARIFEPFFTTKSPGEGTGLGLHISRQVIQKCQGSITLQSAYNEGTRFIVRLPAYHR